MSVSHEPIVNRYKNCKSGSRGYLAPSPTPPHKRLRIGRFIKVIGPEPDSKSSAYLIILELPNFGKVASSFFGLFTQAANFGQNFHKMHRPSDFHLSTTGRQQ